MNHSIKHRLLSALAAITLTCSLCAESVQALAEELAPPAVSYDDSELIDVIVRLNGDAVLAAPEASGQGADYIDTAAAQSAEDELRSAQDKAEKHIRKLYPDLEIRRRFTLTTNGFTCTLPETIIAEIEDDPLIESVTEVQTDIAVEPQLATAKELGGITEFCNSTGNTGEGEVIAIIDTEFNISHDMFAPMTDKETKINKENITEINSKNGFSTKLDADKVYVSNKIPFAYDYGDNTPYTLSAPAHYHGTHVSGIAAGNRITTDEGKEISGIAPDAQLLMMKVYGNMLVDNNGSFTVSDESIAAAIEDAVKLRADVINMSFGRVYEYYFTLAYADAIEAAANAGIMLCASAGNLSNGPYGSANVPVENVDTGYISEPSIFPDVFSVASADNAVYLKNTLIANAPYISPAPSFSYCECGAEYCREVLSDIYYPIVFIGQGQLSEITEENVSRKIVAFSGSPEEYYYLDQKCLDSGAVGIIVPSDEYEGLQEGYLFSASLPVAVVSEAAFADLQQKNVESVTFVGTSSADMYTPSISSFSSYGVGTSLDLKPEIMGIGGSVLSAAYDNKTTHMSGTSMASPYVAGCAALFDQHMKQEGISIKGIDRVHRIKNILMNSAVPYSDDGTALSPRRQGAGLVALDKAIDDKVIMTGSTGKAAIELRDQLGDEFSFELNITNISSEDVTFPYSYIALTSDREEYRTNTEKYYISGQTVLETTNDLDMDITVPAGETVTKTVNVKLNSVQSKEQSAVFTKGFFVEGYVSLHGADNCCDISIPLIGFHGDWCMVPTLSEQDRYRPATKVSIGYNELRTDISFARAAQMVKNFVNNDVYLRGLNPERPESYPETLDYHFSDAQKELFYKLADGVTYFSPNNDVFADYLGCYYVPVREATFTDIDLYDTDGKLLYKTEENSHNSLETQLALLPYETYSLPDGRYSGRIDSYIRYGEGKNKVQSYPLDIEIDTTAPQVTYDTVTEDGRKLLKITATDESLDGIYIMGSKIGRDTYESNAAFNALALTQRTLSYSNYIETDKRIFTNYPQPSSTEKVGDFRSILTGLVRPQSHYNVCEIIPAEPNENGTFSYTYDVTGMSDYSVTVVDRAFNEFTFHSETSDEPVYSFAPGLWRSVDEYNGIDTYYEFTEGNAFTLIFTSDKERFKMFYTIEDDRITFTDNWENDKNEGTIKWLGPYNAIINWDDGRTETFIFEFISMVEEVPSFYSDAELSDLAKTYYESISGSRPELTRTVYNAVEDTVSIYVYDYLDGREDIHDVYNVQRLNACGVDIVGNTIDLKKAARLNKEGVWSAYTASYDLNIPRYFNIIEVNDNSVSGLYAYQSDGIEHKFTCDFDGDTAIFSFESYENEGEPSMKAEMIGLNADRIALTWGNNFYEVFTYHPEASEISDIGFMTNDTLMELTRKHFTKTTHTEPDHLSVVYAGLENIAEVRIFLTDADGFEEWNEVYTVDIITGKGHNSNGMPVDLLNDFREGYSLGDVNNDKKIDAKDASEILVYYSKMSTGGEGGFTGEQKTAANVNGDSMIDAKDASLILTYYSYTSTGGTGSLEWFLSPKG